MPSNDLDIQIEEYLEGRMDAPRKAQFEARLKSDPELRHQVETTTNSIKMVRQALVKIDPGEEFEDQVSSKIISITQSNPNLRPAAKGSGKLSAGDPDAKLILDPQAEKERKRLVILAVVAGILFAAAIAVIVRAVFSG